MNFKNMLVVMLLLLVPALNLESAVGAAPGGGKIFSRFLNQIDGDKHRGQNNDFLIFKVLHLQDPIRVEGHDVDLELQSVNGMKKIVPGTGFVVNGGFGQVLPSEFVEGYFITDNVNINFSAGRQATSGVILFKRGNMVNFYYLPDAFVEYDQLGKKLLFKILEANVLNRNIFEDGGSHVLNDLVFIVKKDDDGLFVKYAFGTKDGEWQRLEEYRVERYSQDEEDEDLGLVDLFG